MWVWNDDWRDELKEIDYECYERLCECRNTKKDIEKISKLMYKYNKKRYTAEDCLIRTLEWLGDWNSQFELVDIDKDEYNDILNMVKL